MRASGVVADPAGLGAHDHLCWAFDDLDAFLASARVFLAEGLALGQRVAFVGGPGLDVMGAELAALARHAARPGAASTTDLAATYGDHDLVSPTAQVDAYARATAEALAAGFTGLRVAAEATTLVRTPAQREAFARYEQLIDQRMATMPFSALCAYDRRQLGDDAVADLSCMHPATNDHHARFGVFARPGCTFALRGEVDALDGTRFRRALGRVAAPAEGEGPAVVDAVDAAFLDHRAVLALADHARHTGGAVLRSRSTATARLVELLEVDDVLEVEVRA